MKTLITLITAFVFRPALLALLSLTTVNAANVTVVISGLGGNDEYTEKFDEYATAIADEAKRIALTQTDVMLLRGGAAKKEIVTALFDAIATRTDVNSFTAYFIGHGSYDGRSYKFNIPGPDITDTELLALLDINYCYQKRTRKNSCVVPRVHGRGNHHSCRRCRQKRKHKCDGNI